MPTIDYFDGIKINIYSIDHVPPHIHVIDNEYEALLIISTRKTYAGSLPARQLKKAIAWLNENEADAMAIFYELNPDLKR